MEKKRVDLKELLGTPKKSSECIKTIRTPAAGVEHTNMDGSERQKALEKMKAGEKVRMIWDAEGKNSIYLLRGGKMKRLNLADCFGKLNSKVAADVIRWMTKENIIASATVANIVGGTRKRPKLGCVIELKVYETPEKEKK